LAQLQEPLHAVFPFSRVALPGWGKGLSDQRHAKDQLGNRIVQLPGQLQTVLQDGELVAMCAQEQVLAPTLKGGSQ
jgi:hypothetical protein